MDPSPFDYTGPLPPERVRGRDALLDVLTERVTARSPTALLGPRRFGKTSVLQRIGVDLTEMTTITVDLMPVQSPHDAARALTKALLASDANVARDATEVSATLGFNILALRGEITTTRASNRADPEAAFPNLVDTLVKTALRRPTLVIFDEFQQIAAVPNGTAVLRAALQHHYKDIGLLFAGSAPSAMRDIFANHKQPFLHQVGIVTIEALTFSAVEDIITAGFAETGRQAGAVAGLVHQFAQGHPLRTMQAAHMAWVHAETGPADQAWGEALAALRRSERPAVADFYAQLPKAQQKVLRILAQDGAIFGAAADALQLGKGPAQRARQALLDEGHLLDDDGKLRVTDPFLSDWLKLTHPI
ncbi:MAG TPA: hypothetical protein VGW38_09600 [Chloroflexota bacterium]|nr:hypothetical protein [Chloroflexota bacterium]